jgi:hypothetical protein
MAWWTIIRLLYSQYIFYLEHVHTEKRTKIYTTGSIFQIPTSRSYVTEYWHDGPLFGIYLFTGLCVQLFLGTSFLDPKIWSIDQQPIWLHLYNIDHWWTLVVVESIQRFQKHVGVLLYILNVDNNPICLSNHIMVSTSWQSVCKYQCTCTHDFWDLTNTNFHPLIIILSQLAHT